MKMRIIDIIELVDMRNKNLLSDKPMGINIDKYFMPSVANTIGVDLKTYKLVPHNCFACNLMHVGRDERVPMAINKKEDPVLVSPAYLVFRVKESVDVLPDFLMLWFRRPTFDRNAWFFTAGDVRGGLDKKDFFNMEVHVPDIATQRRIVAEYQTIENRIGTHRQCITQLEDTAKTLYKKNFVDGINPDQLPQGWSYKSVFDVSKITYGFPFDSELFSTDSTLKPIIRIRDILSNTTDTFTSEDVDDKYFISENDVLVGMDGVFHMTIWHGKKSLQNQRVVRFTADASKNISPYQVFYSIIGPVKEAEGSVEGTTVAHLGDKDVKKMLVLVADDLTQEKTYKHFQAILDMVGSLKKECMLLESMKQLLLEKLAK